MNSINSISYGDITFERGAYYRVLAASGVGKSSLCNFIYGIRRDSTKRVAFDGRDVADLTISEWCDVRCRHIAYLRQDLRLFGALTAYDNIQLKHSLTGTATRREIEDMLGALGLSDKVNWRADRLSIGQQQRVALIRALCQPFDFLLLDEPVSHLDQDNNAIAARMIVEHAARYGAAVITTSVGNNLVLEDCGVTVTNISL